MLFFSSFYRTLLSLGIFSALTLVAPTLGAFLPSHEGCEKKVEDHLKSHVKGPMNFTFEIEFPTTGLALPERELYTLYVLRPDGKIKTFKGRVTVEAGDLAFPLTLTKKVEVFDKEERILNGAYHYGVEVRTKNIQPGTSTSFAQIVSFTTTVDIKDFESVILPDQTPAYSRQGRVFQIDATWVFNPEKISLLKD